MSNLILDKDGDSVTLNRIQFNNPFVLTINTIKSLDFVSKNDLDGNPVRLDFTAMTTEAPTISAFKTFAESYKGLIVSCQFEGRLHFGYIESYNISYTYTRSVERQTVNELYELEITSGEETEGEISFSFISLTNLVVTTEDETYGLGLSLR